MCRRRRLEIVVNRMRSRWQRIALRLLGALCICAVLYILSFGPATAWVVSAVSGRQPSELNPATYDARLSIYKRVYDPLFGLRAWLRWGVSLRWPDELFWRYEALFARPTKLADGRQVFTTVGPGPRPGESTATFFSRLMGSDEPTPKAGTEVYDLPLSGRALVILASQEDDVVWAVLDAAIEHSFTFYADLKLP